MSPVSPRIRAALTTPMPQISSSSGHTSRSRTWRSWASWPISADRRATALSWDSAMPRQADSGRARSPSSSSRAALRPGQRPGRGGQVRAEVMHQPAEPVGHPRPLRYQVITVIGQPAHVQDLRVQPGGGQEHLLPQRHPRIGQGIDRVGLAALPAPGPRSGHQPGGHEHDFLPGSQQLPDQPGRHVPHVLHRPLPLTRLQVPGPGDQLPVSLPPRFDGLHRLLPAQLIGRGRGVGLLVRVHPEYHHDQCLHPCSAMRRHPGPGRQGKSQLRQQPRSLSSHAAPGPGHTRLPSTSHGQASPLRGTADHG